MQCRVSTRTIALDDCVTYGPRSETKLEISSTVSAVMDVAKKDYNEERELFSDQHFEVRETQPGRITYRKVSRLEWTAL